MILAISLKSILLSLFIIAVMWVVFKMLLGMGKAAKEDKDIMEDWEYDAYHRENKTKVG